MGAQAKGKPRLVHLRCSGGLCGPSGGWGSSGRGGGVGTTGLCWGWGVYVLLRGLVGPWDGSECEVPEVIQATALPAGLTQENPRSAALPAAQYFTANGSLCWPYWASP